MKKVGFSCISLFILLIILFKSPVFADTVTGDSSVETHVTNINNNGSVTSHVETTVNGKTDVEDSNQPGELDVKNINGTVTVTRTPQLSISPTLTSTPTPTIKHKPPFLSNFWESMRNFFKRIFHNL